MSGSGPGLPTVLVRALARLDQRLESAIERSAERFAIEPGEDPFRGLYIGHDDALRAVRESETAPMDGEADPDWEGLWAPGDFDDASGVTLIADAFGLAPFDLSILVVALAPEIDSRYERVFGYLQDDVTKRRATIELTLQLLCESQAALLGRRIHFRAAAPLLRHRLLWLDTDRQPGLGASLRVDEQILHALLEVPGLDSRLGPFVDLAPVTGTLSNSILPTEDSEHLSDVMRVASESGSSCVLLLEGPSGGGKRSVAELLSRRSERDLLVFHVGRAAARSHGEQEFAVLVTVAFREAWLRGALLYIEGLEALVAPLQDDRRAEVVAAARSHPGPVILGSTMPWIPLAGTLPSFVHCRLVSPPADARGEIWRSALNGNAVDEEVLERLADRFVLTPGQITDAASRAVVRTGADPAGARPLDVELFDQARAQSGHQLENFARRIQPTRAWKDIVLPTDSMGQLKEMCEWVAYRRRVLSHWGFGVHLVRGRGVTALFSGPSGTGKTMAAEIVASELGVDLFRIDLAGVVSKYIGETEKNLEKIFRAAEYANGVLFFDEADALFGKRSEVRDSHDRYANVEISYLLQRMEEYEGIAILATNLRGNLDDAFIRRLAFSVHFPFPNEESRRLIWRRVWPESAPVDEALDFNTVAERFQMSGGNIRNVALAAAYVAAADGGRVKLEHLLHGVRREYQKMGKVLTEKELVSRMDPHGGGRGEPTEAQVETAFGGPA